MQNRKWASSKGWSQEVERSMISDLEAQGWHAPDIEAWVIAAAEYLPSARHLPVEMRSNPHGYVFWCFQERGLDIEDLGGRIVLRDPGWFDFGMQPGLPF